MKTYTISFPEKDVIIYLDSCFSEVHSLLNGRKGIIITDSNVFSAYHPLFASFKTIVIPAGESSKHIETIQNIIDELISLEADRHTILLGIGGGVVTDITGFVASLYMRGIAFGFIPTTILNLVDASIGGKNGIDYGKYKNLLGTINQPEFILHDYSFLKTLPDFEWENGFAEIIKHACIRDAQLLHQLGEHSISFYQKNISPLSELLCKNIQHKSAIVTEDPYEKDIRKLLNFGHTIGHALERNYQLSHGHAVSIGMVLACEISAIRNNFSQTPHIIRTLNQYNLPTSFAYQTEDIFHILKLDKKRLNQSIQMILLNEIGDAKVETVPLEELEKYLNNLMLST